MQDAHGDATIRARQHARRDGPVVSAAGVEGAAGAESGAARRHPRSARDRSRGDKDFEHFCQTTGCELLESGEQPGGVLRFRPEEAGLREARDGGADHHPAADGGRRRRLGRSAGADGPPRPRAAADRHRSLYRRVRHPRPRDGAARRRAASAWAVFKDTVPDPTTEALEAGVARMRRGRLRQPRRDRRRQLDRHRQGHVGAVRQWRPDARLQGAERHPAGRAADRRDPDHRRHRLRGDPLYGHHRYRDRREDADRRPRVLPGGGDRRLRADPDDAAAGSPPTPASTA